MAFFTYGDKEDLNYSNRLPGIKIIPAYAGRKKIKNRKLAFLQSFWLPVSFRKIFSQYDILKTNQMWGAWVPLAAKWLTGRPLLLRCGFEHYYTLLAENFPAWEKCTFYLFSKIMYLSADHISVTTNKIAEFVTKRFSIRKSKISILPNFIDTQLFDIGSGKEIFSNRILFVGRLSREKNLFALIEACKKAGVGLDLVGNGKLRAKLEEKSVEVNADVRFLGILPNSRLPGIYAQYPIFILVSLYEGNPKSILEAMSCQRAVVGANVDGIREIIKNQENGVLCGTSVDEISSAIFRIKDDKEIRNRLGINARKYVIDNFSISNILQKEQDVYSVILKNKR